LFVILARPWVLNIFSFMKYERLSSENMNMLYLADYYRVIPAGMNSSDAALTSSNNVIEKGASELAKPVIEIIKLVSVLRSELLRDIGLMGRQKVYGKALTVEDCSQSIGSPIQADQVEGGLEGQGCNGVHRKSVASCLTSARRDYRNASNETPRKYSQ
jgi:hypothetical protein